MQIYRARSGTIDASRERQIALLCVATRRSSRSNVARSYLFNPYTFLCTAALSTSTFDNALYVLALLFACTRRPSASMLALALLTTSSLTSALLLPPLALLLITSPKSGLLYPQPFSASLGSALPIAARYFGYLAALAGVSTLVVGDWSWVARTWGAT